MPDKEATETVNINSAMSIMELQNQVMLLAVLNGVVDEPVPYTKEIGEKVVVAMQANMEQGLKDYSASPAEAQAEMKKAWAASIQAQNANLPADQALPVDGYDEKAALAVLNIAVSMQGAGQNQVLNDVGFTDFGRMYKVISEIDVHTQALDTAFSKYTHEQVEAMALEEIAQLTAHAQQQDAAPVAPAAPALSEQELADNKLVQDGLVKLVDNMKANVLLGKFDAVKNIDTSPLESANGVWDAASLKLVTDNIELLQDVLELQEDFSGKGYETGFGALLGQKIDNNIASPTLYAVDSVLPKADRTVLFDAMERVVGRDGFSVTEFTSPEPQVQSQQAQPQPLGAASSAVGGATYNAASLSAIPGVDRATVQPKDETVSEEKVETQAEKESNELSDRDIKQAALVVEATLATLTDSLDGLGGGIIGKLGADDLLKDLFSGADFEDGVWDANSQDATASVLMGLKVLASQGIDPEKSPYGKNPDGTIDPQIAS